MRPGQQNKRLRGRGRKGPNPLSRSYESNGPDVKIRGTAQHIAEKYTTLARDASASGDRVMAENYLQHAEHYGRIVAAAQGTFQLQRDENDMDEDGDEDGDDDGMIDVGGFSNGQGSDAERAPQNYQPGGQDVRDAGNGNGTYNSPRQRDKNQGNQVQDNRGNRDGNRQSYQARDNQARDNQVRDNRDGNRENNRNGEGRERFRDRNENGRTENGRNENVRAEQPRVEGNRNDAPREGRERNGNRGEFRENRENRDRSLPNGVGPQPFVNEIRSPIAASQVPAPSQAEPVEDVVHIEPAYQPVVETADLSDASPQAGDAVSAETMPRRRGRPRRPRLGEASEASTSIGDAPQPRFDAPIVPAPIAVPHASQADVQPAEAPRTAEPVAADADGAVETKAKRKPGRPRKKKPDDEGGPGEDGGDHLPAFLLASNA